MTVPDLGKRSAAIREPADISRLMYAPENYESELYNEARPAQICCLQIKETMFGRQSTTGGGEGIISGIEHDLLICIGCSSVKNAQMRKLN